MFHSAAFGEEGSAKGRGGRERAAHRTAKPWLLLDLLVDEVLESCLAEERFEKRAKAR